MNDFNNFTSPFTWRYGTKPMREIWSEIYKRKLWRRLWVGLAEAQTKAGFVTEAQVAELRARMEDIDIERAHQIEAEIHHDLMAEVKTFAEQCPTAGGIIHLGATSMDIEDNAEVLRLRESLDLVIQRLESVLDLLSQQIETWADCACMAYTHIQPAEITTVGFRLAQYAQDLLYDLDDLRRVRYGLRGKGFRGAVGTSASYQELLAGTPLTSREMEMLILKPFDLETFVVTTQTYPRKQDWLVLNSLASVAGSVYKFGLDLRILQSPNFGEMAEPFGKKQVGSSAMPFKRNPINAEKLCSLARFVASLPHTLWDNAAHSMLERTLDDSANRRIVLPEAFLAVDEMLFVMGRIIKDLRIDKSAIERNLSRYGVFSALERLLMALGKGGADRQAMHEILREHALRAWDLMTANQPNPLVENLKQDERILRHLNADQIEAVMNATAYVGDAPSRAREIISYIHKTKS